MPGQFEMITTRLPTDGIISIKQNNDFLPKRNEMKFEVDQVFDTLLTSHKERCKLLLQENRKVTLSYYSDQVVNQLYCINI